MWKTDDKPAAVDSIIVTSSRDGAEVPKVASALRLAASAERAGWRVEQRYALAVVGGVEVQSVSVRLDRADEWAWAVWWNKSRAGWRFEGAFIGLVRHGYRALIGDLTKGTAA